MTPIGDWDSSLIFGHTDQGHNGSAWLAESVLEFGIVNYIIGGTDIVDKDELFRSRPRPSESSR